MKKKSSSINLPAFFRLIRPNEVPSLVHFYENEHTRIFYQELILKHDRTRPTKRAVAITAIFFIVLQVIVACFFAASWVNMAKVSVVTFGFFCSTVGIAIMVSEVKMNNLAKEIDTYTPKLDFISAHSRFLFEYIQGLEGKRTNTKNLREFLVFGTRLAEIPTSLIEKVQPSPYRGAVEIYWRTLAKHLNEFGYYEPWVEDRTLTPGRTLPILVDMRNFVSAWRKHKEVLATIGPHDFILTFIQLEEVIQRCLATEEDPVLA